MKLTLYRYDDPVDLEFPSFKVREFYVIRETSKGYWINSHAYGFKKRWVPMDGKNIFAYDSQKKALENYIKRKEFQVDVKKYQLDFAKHNLKEANKILEEWNDGQDSTKTS